MKKISFIFLFILILYSSPLYAANIPTSLIPKQPADIISIDNYYRDTSDNSNKSKEALTLDDLINPHIIRWFNNISFSTISFNHIVWSELPKQFLMLFLDIRFLFLILFLSINIAFLLILSSVKKFNL